MQNEELIYPLTSQVKPVEQSRSITDAINLNAYESYSYSYPHKSAYRVLHETVSLSDAWINETKKSLFLYLHIPFCEMRCGFCNLFSLSRPQDELLQAYLKQITRQAKVFKDNVAPFCIDQFAIGGGTPSLLTEKQIDNLFQNIDNNLSVNIDQIPGSFEVSPQTINKEKLTLLKDYNLSRISIGIQSFIELETKVIGRPQNIKQSKDALALIKSFDFETFNIDLIYGVPGQSEQDWLLSLTQAMVYQPEEVYLYPLYIRELTGLWNADKRNNHANAGVVSEHCLYLYQVGRDFLLSQGYTQISMRMFQLSGQAKSKVPQDYSCQDDGMFGLGAGARSYTRNLHYSFDYSVNQKSVKSIIENYCQYSENDFSYINHGIYLNENEQKRRYIIQSLLLIEGVTQSDYYRRFKSKIIDDFPQLLELIDEHLAVQSDGKLCLTPKGVMFSDAIGPWLNSPAVKDKMYHYQLC